MRDTSTNHWSQVAKAILLAVISTTWWLDVISAFISLHLQSYTAWVLLHASLIGIACWLLIGLFDVSKKTRVKQGSGRHRKKKPQPNWLTWILPLLRGWKLVVPALLGFYYFLYEFDFRYRWNRFEDNEIGILVADFRESLANIEFAQGKYSNMLKEGISGMRHPCEPKFELSTYNTAAFFTSRDEANKFAIKIGASIVIWGEVHSSDSGIRIRTRIDSPWELTTTINEREAIAFDTKTKADELWVTGDPIPSEKEVVNLVNRDLVLFLEWKIRNSEGNSPRLLKFLECSYKAYTSGLTINGRVSTAMSIASTAYKIGQYDKSMEYYQAARGDLEQFPDSFDNHSLLLESANESISNCWAMKDTSGLVFDSTKFYALKAIEVSPCSITELHLLTRLALWDKNYPYATSLLGRCWEQSYDTISGDLIVDVYQTWKRPIDSSFYRVYDSLYPGRFFKRKGGRVLVTALSVEDTLKGVTK